MVFDGPRDDCATGPRGGPTPPYFEFGRECDSRVYTIFGLMGSLRGMPGNYENNYYPRARYDCGRARRTRVHAVSVIDEAGERKGRGCSRERTRRSRILTERGIIVPVIRPRVDPAKPEFAGSLGENARNRGSPLVSRLDNVFVGRCRRLSLSRFTP